MKWSKALEQGQEREVNEQKKEYSSISLYKIEERKREVKEKKTRKII
jgi:hypothetical protein